MKRDMRFEEFVVGDSYSFTRTITLDDFWKFRDLSFDASPLHHDERYCRETAFERPVAPMHLVAMPLSSVAGMVLPGHRALYLGHELKSHRPVPYGEELTYSSKIVGKSEVENTLSLRTIVFRGADVFLSANQLVQVRDEEISNDLLPERPELRARQTITDQFVRARHRE